MSPRYVVASEEYGTVVPITDEGQGPMEYGRDVWIGAAKNKTEARRLAYIAWRDRKDNNGEYLEWNRSDGRHPMAGVTVEELQPCPTCGLYDECVCLVAESSE